MFTAAELIDALQRRSRLRLRRDQERAPGEFPPGWARWFDQLAAAPGRVIGALAHDIVNLLAQRPLANPPRRVSELSRWQAFNALWRQHWHPPEPDERRLRLAAVAVTAAWHLLFALVLLWLLIFQYLGMPPEPASAGEDVVQVEYIGRGTPQDQGGGPPAAAEPAAQAADAVTRGQEAAEPAQASATPATASVEVPSVDAPLPEVPQRDVPEPQVPPVELEQPVVVSEPVPNQPTVFTLPPTRRTVEPTVRTPELAAPEASVRAIEVPEPVQPIRRAAPQPELSTPDVRTREPQVVAREVAAPVAPVPTRTLPQPAIRAPEIAARTPGVRQRDVREPSGAQAASTQPATASTGGAPAQGSAATPAQGRAPGAALPSTGTAQAGAQRPTAQAGTGTQGGAPGSVPTPARGDDWGASTRNRPGGQAGQRGLYDDQGRVRLADAPGSASARPPPGATEEIRDLDRAGTWLKRKPTDYEPTSFDRFWVPHETLLAEWVRRGIRQVAIPIPGTSKKLMCVVSVLQLGGGCGIADPNLNEQPASARPPPDIPFKPHLQEDNGSVKPAG